jgi:hypothetical protein
MPVVIPIALGAAELTAGLIKDAKAKKDAKALKAEEDANKYQIGQQSKDELKLAQSELAQGGMSAQAEQAYKAQNDAQLSSSLSTILKGGGNVSDVGKLYGASNEGLQKLAIIKDQLRSNKIQNLISAQHNMSDQQDKQFEYNVAAPERDRAQAIAGARTGAQQEISSGINTAGSALMSGIQNAHEEKMYNISTGNTGGYGSGAYGTQQRGDLGGSQSTISNDTPMAAPSTISNNNWDNNQYISS